MSLVALRYLLHNLNHLNPSPHHLTHHRHPCCSSITSQLRENPDGPIRYSAPSVSRKPWRTFSRSQGPGKKAALLGAITNTFPSASSMASIRTQNYTIRGPGTVHNLGSSKSHTQRHSAEDSRPSSHGARFPMSLTPSYNEERRVHRALSLLAPELDVQSVERLPTARIQTLHNITLADGKSLVLATPPEIDRKRPLRSEEKAVKVEAAAIQWLAALPQEGCQRSQEGNRLAYGGCEPGRAVVNYTGDSVNVSYVSGFIPKLYKYIPSRGESGTTELALWDPVPGRTIAQLSRSLSAAERSSVDFQTGQLFRRVASHISPTGNFGPVGSILRSRSKVPFMNALGFLHPSAQIEGTTESFASDIGRKSWSTCFRGYIEEVSADLSDFYIQMRFDVLRDHYSRFKHLLDKVETPRLVAMQGTDDSNVMVSIAGETDGALVGGWSLGDVQPNSSPKDTNSTGARSTVEDITVTGLRDWSFLCFGDPLFSYVFQNEPSFEFRRGLRTGFSDSDPLRHEPPIEDEHHAPVRLALYKAWHAACGVARQYRRVRDNTDAEMIWRGTFIDALEALDRFDDDGNETVEGSPAKRPRSGRNL